MEKITSYITSKDSRLIAKNFLEAIFDDKLDLTNDDILGTNKTNDDRNLVFKAIMVSFGLHANKYLYSRGEFLVESFESDYLTVVTGASFTFKKSLTDCVIQLYRLLYGIRTRLCSINPTLVEPNNLMG